MEETTKTALVSNVNLFIYLFAYYLFRYMCVGMLVQVRAKLAGVDSVLPLYGFQEWNSGPPLPGKLSCRSSRMPQQLTIVSTDKVAREVQTKDKKGCRKCENTAEKWLPSICSHTIMEVITQKSMTSLVY